MDHQKIVREAAAALKVAIDDACAAGYRVDLTSRSEDLDRVAISETGNRPTTDVLVRPQVSTFNRPIAD